MTLDGELIENLFPDTVESIDKAGLGPMGKKEKDKDEESQISRGDDDENHTPEKDKDFSETLHGGNTSGADRRHEPEAERFRFKSSSSTEKPPPKNDWSLETP